jgi:nucleotide-binding universal stress UspA family protein
VFLLPLFFAFTGLRTSIGLVSGAELWFFAGLILLVAVLGKFGGSMLAARATGLPWREASALGVLMNTRGLMELVILSIGLELGVISPTLFTMMVLMALITTFMTTPLLELVYPARLIRQQAIGMRAEDESFRTLIPISLPSAGPALLAVARLLAPQGREHEVFALHLHVAGEQSLMRVPQDRRPSEESVLRPVLEAAPALGMEVRPLSFVTRSPGIDIAEIADMKAIDLVLLGSHRPVISRSVLAGTVGEVLSRTQCDVVVLIDRGMSGWRRLLVPHAGSPHDDAALELARRIARSSGAELTILRVHEPGRAPRQAAGVAAGAVDGGGSAGTPAHRPGSAAAERVLGVETSEPLRTLTEEGRRGYDLLVVGVSRTWGLEPTLFGPREEELARLDSASLILVRRHI